MLLVHAHPDDESLFTGHVIADRIAAKSEVMVFTLTRGERGKVKLADLKSLEGRSAEMGAFRTAELMNALSRQLDKGKAASFGMVRPCISSIGQSQPPSSAKASRCGK